MKDLTIEEYFEGELYYDDYGANILLKKPNGKKHHIAAVRGFGCISKHFNHSDRKTIPFQDSVGKFIIEAIKEKLSSSKKCYLIQHKETLLNLGCFDTREKAKKFINGNSSLAIQEMQIG